LAPSATPTESQEAAEATTLTGEYAVEPGEDTGPIEAVFTPSGEGAWTVEFYFTFQGQDYTFGGTAEGSLTEGTLSGFAENESRKRMFTFIGEFTDGRFEGFHAEVENGAEVPTGTMYLER
jgi:hypothetical protein